MATIGAAVDSKTKEEFDALARARDMSPSRLAAVLIREFLQNGQAPAPAAGSALWLPPQAQAGREARTDKVSVRLEPFYYAELGRLAAERDWFRSTYLANLLCAHVDRRPVLCADEVDALRQVARYLADLGRNVNQIARKLNSSSDQAHLAFGLQVDEIRMLVDLEKEAVKGWLKASHDYWGLGDG
jgi:predicted transcriptional regulator